MPGSFRYTVWDPWMIVAQMATLQCAYYVTLGIWIFLLDALGGYPRFEQTRISLKLFNSNCFI